MSLLHSPPDSELPPRRGERLLFIEMCVPFPRPGRERAWYRGFLSYRTNLESPPWSSFFFSALTEVSRFIAVSQVTEYCVGRL